MRLIFHQIWNQRKMNGWIFAELLIVSVFLWTVMDPLYMLVSNYLIPNNYDGDNVYIVRMQRNDYAPENLSADLYINAFRQSAQVIKDLPEVAELCIMNNSSVISGTTWSGTEVWGDTTEMKKDTRDTHYSHAQYFSCTTELGGDMLHLYRMTDALTGKTFTLPKDAEGKCIITENMAMKIFGTNKVVGKHIYFGETDGQEVCGVLKDVKYHDFKQPYPLVIEVVQKMSNYMINLPGVYVFAIKLKKDVDTEAFKARFNNHIAPKLKSQFFSFNSIKSIDDYAKDSILLNGFASKIRLQSVLIGFALLCILLGMLGTFWMRCSARRGDIGLMRSMGATRGRITRQFLTESAIIVTVAFALTVPAMYYYADLNGLYSIDDGLIDNNLLSMDYPQNRFGSHFAIVTALSYIMLLAVSLVGTYIPARVAAKTLPAEALKDE